MAAAERDLHLLLGKFAGGTVLQQPEAGMDRQPAVQAAIADVREYLAVY